MRETTGVEKVPVKLSTIKEKRPTNHWTGLHVTQSPFSSFLVRSVSSNINRQQLRTNMKSTLVFTILFIAVLQVGCSKTVSDLDKSYRNTSMEYAEVSFTEGFRSLKWNVLLKNDPNFLLKNSDKYGNQYFRKNERLTLYGANIQKILYKTYDDKLFLVKISFTGQVNYKLIFDELNKLYGVASRMKQDNSLLFVEHRWGLLSPENENAAIGLILDYSAIKKTGRFMVIYEKNRPPLDIYLLKN